MTADYWADLPEELRAKLNEIAWRYLRLRVAPDLGTALELFAWQRLEIDVLEAHNQWLAKVRSAVEREGGEWNRENFLHWAESVE
ncbi:hypothetical protein [Mycobacterium attenuatum]|uniref:hypothetical protein n=1 Tax=Mycobacterium attenuatum TaxID=2341086 RepID=UPI000F03D5CD|nr:hypothetical protein [Mycobacterium attenuatum]VBA61226.1 hypothetical protein LAUMK41_04602 [Mycobacterium attenuatum]